MKKHELYNLCLMEVGRIKRLDSYHTVFLSTMLLRKMRHPEESLKEITSRAKKKMKSRYGKVECEESEEEQMRKNSMDALKKSESDYGKNNILIRTDEKSLEQLEEALEGSDMPKEWMESRCYTVEEILERMSKEINVFAKINKIKGLGDDSIKFWAEIVFRKKYHPEVDFRENIWETLNEFHLIKEDSQKTKEEVIDFRIKTMELMLSLKKVKIPPEWEVSQENIVNQIYQKLIQ